MAQEQPHMPLLASLYEDFLGHQDTAQFGRAVSVSYTLATLERLTHSSNRTVRRASILALGCLGDYEANHVLGRALNDPDRGVRSLAETGIHTVWSRAGNSYQRAQLQIIIRLVAALRYDEAIRRATELIEQAPWFAEVWNQRAHCHFASGQYAESIRDCRQALEINPYHFAAAAEMGQCHIKLGDPKSALDCFRRALRLNPNLEGVRAQLIHLQRSLKDQ
ncbi:MAG: tetratricopeptide repeat protein [Planctomycetia bacterium]|nr:tetratricopeptide repeat protein [Planctomycetia bacterium]